MEDTSATTDYHCVKDLPDVKDKNKIRLGIKTEAALLPSFDPSDLRLKFYPGLCNDTLTWGPRTTVLPDDSVKGSLILASSSRHIEAALPGCELDGKYQSFKSPHSLDYNIK